ncbi:hypothetical protein M3J09_010508 [Ascochyta lentis]
MNRKTFSARFRLRPTITVCDISLLEAGSVETGHGSPAYKRSLRAGVVSLAIIDVRFSQHSDASARTREQQLDLGFTVAEHCLAKRNCLRRQTIGGYLPICDPASALLFRKMGKHYLLSCICGLR